jgi:hypothetical protein
MADRNSVAVDFNVTVLCTGLMQLRRVLIDVELKRAQLSNNQNRFTWLTVRNCEPDSVLCACIDFYFQQRTRIKLGPLVPVVSITQIDVRKTICLRLINTIINGERGDPTESHITLCRE